MRGATLDRKTTRSTTQHVRLTRGRIGAHGSPGDMLRDGVGAVVRMFGTALDITDREKKRRPRCAIGEELVSGRRLRKLPSGFAN